MRGRDADGHWGPVSAVWLTITRTHTISGTVTDRLTGEPLTATVEITGSDPAIPGSWTVTDVASAGQYSMTVTSGPAYTLTVAAAEYLTATLGLGSVDADRFEPFALLPLTATVKVFVPVLVQPDALVR